MDEDRIYNLGLFGRCLLGEELTEDEQLDLEAFEEVGKDRDMDDSQVKANNADKDNILVTKAPDHAGALLINVADETSSDMDEPDGNRDEVAGSHLKNLNQPMQHWPKLCMPMSSFWMRICGAFVRNRTRGWRHDGVQRRCLQGLEEGT